MSDSIKITCISNNGDGASFFDSREVQLNGDDNRRLSEQISAENFRLRTSGSAYSSSWHVAGDPTLLVMLNGRFKVELRNGESKTFSAGEMFIAQDYLPAGIEFDDTLHGHRAEVIGGDELRMLHLKLDKRS